MQNAKRYYLGFLGGLLFIAISMPLSYAQEKRESSYTSVIEEPFDKVMARDKAQKAEVMKRHMDLLNERYDLSQKVAADAAMSGGKPLPVGPTAKLKGKLTWEKLAGMTTDEVKDKNVFPYLPLSHPNHSSGGMLFSQKQIKQVSRLERFDLDFDLPDHFLPEFPPPIYLTTHKDMGMFLKASWCHWTIIMKYSMVS